MKLNPVNHSAINLPKVSEQRDNVSRSSKGEAIATKTQLTDSEIRFLDLLAQIVTEAVYRDVRRPKVQNPD